MKKANILKNTAKTLVLSATNIKPHNVIFFDDNKFMEHVKNVLWNEHHIASVMIKKENIDMFKGYCNLCDRQYEDDMTGLLYIMSSAIIDPYMKLEDYFDKPYSIDMVIEL